MLSDYEGNWERKTKEWTVYIVLWKVPEERGEDEKG